MRCFWYGYGGGSWMAEKLRHVIEDKLDMELVTIHEHPDANIKWDLNTVFEELKKADIIIVPANFKRQPCKSANRVTQAMALGKPVVCDPLPAYMDVVKNFHNAIMLKNGTEEEWEFVLDLLKNDEDLRNKISRNALKTAKDYTKKQMSIKWLNLLNKIKVDTPETIDVVIPTKDNLKILDECLKSFNNSSLNEEIYIIDNNTENNDLEEMVKKYGVPVEIKEI